MKNDPTQQSDIESKASPSSGTHRLRRVYLFAAIIIGVGGLLVACGGGGGDDKDAAVQEVERAQALGLSDKLPVSWAPTTITFSLNPGARQDVPITLTTTKALKNAKIIFVPDLRNAVTVTPDTIAALAAGQSATVTLTFAPAATDTRKVIAGIVLLFDKNATTSRPLPVKVSFVSPEIVNGIAVPPEPPPDLNNATLAGFDINRNGVRDDVERQLARMARTSADYLASIIYAREYQSLITSPLPSTREAAVISMSKILCSIASVSTNIKNLNIEDIIATTPIRKAAYSAFFSVLVGFGPEDFQPCGN